MAQRDSTDQLEVIDEEAQALVCSICLDLLHEPVTLLCGHTYCFPCLFRLRNVQECPACKEKWTNWPKPNYVLADLISRKYPTRCALREKERSEEATQRHKELEQTIERNKAHRVPILTQELKLFLVAILLAVLFWWKEKYGPR